MMICFCVLVFIKNPHLHKTTDIFNLIISLKNDRQTDEYTKKNVLLCSVKTKPYICFCSEKK